MNRAIEIVKNQQRATAPAVDLQTLVMGASRPQTGEGEMK